MMLQSAVLQRAVGCSAQRAAEVAPHLAEVCEAYGITSAARLAAFLAQLGHESGSLRYVREIASGASYEGREDLGNTQPGDGVRFPGRGFIQITGRANAAHARDALRARLGAQQVPDFEAAPEAMEQLRWACWVSAEFWQHHGCNELADAGNFIGIGRLINRGSATASSPANGEADRVARWETAKKAMAVATPDPVSHPPDPAQPQPAPKVAAAPPATPPEKPMGTSLLAGLAWSLVDIFTPLAKEKISKEIGRHTDTPEVGEKVAAGIIDAAKQLTGKQDPIEAVVAAKADPAVMRDLEDTTLEDLAKLAPVLDKLAAWDAQAWQAEESSREAAAARAHSEANDIAPMLAAWAVRGLYGMIITLAIIILVQVIVMPDHKPSGELLSALTGLMMLAASKNNTVYDYRFGSSRSSGAKDVVIGELSKRPRSSQ